MEQGRRARLWGTESLRGDLGEAPEAMQVSGAVLGQRPARPGVLGVSRGGVRVAGQSEGEGTGGSRPGRRKKL